jgi:hypothetical protein
MVLNIVSHVIFHLHPICCCSLLKAFSTLNITAALEVPKEGLNASEYACIFQLSSYLLMNRAFESRMGLLNIFLTLNITVCCCQLSTPKEGLNLNALNMPSHVNFRRSSYLFLLSEH